MAFDSRFSQTSSEIGKLTALRLLVAVLLLAFLTWLHYQHVLVLLPAWFALSLYLPLLILGLAQSRYKRSDQYLLLHLVFEYQLLTVFLYFTGGASNPFISYFLVLLVFAAYNLSRSWVIMIALVGILDYSLLTQFYQPLSFPMSSHSLANKSFFDWHLAGMWITFLISSLALSLIIPSLVAAKNRRYAELAELRERQLKNEQLIGIATLAAGTAHEMGTPLMTMEMLLDDAVESESDLHRDDIKLLHQQVNLCRTSLQRLTLAGRNSQTHSQQVHAYTWLQSLLHRWRLSQPNALWNAQAFEQQAMIQQSPLLDQAVLNLLDNAAQAGQQPIEIKTVCQEGLWTLSICQPDKSASAQLNQTGLFNSNKQNGMGLGLYLSNASIEQFQGQVHLQAEKSGATRCTIQLPCTQIKAAEHASSNKEKRHG